MNEKASTANLERGVTSAFQTVIDTGVHISAALGGVVILAIAVLVAVSVAKNLVGYGSIIGLNEIIETGSGIAAFLFLPLCQQARGHIQVDLFSNAFPAWFNAGLEIFWDILFAVTWGVVCFCVIQGGLEKLEFAETTSYLRFPLWVVYFIAAWTFILSTTIAATALVRQIRQFGKPNGGVL